MAVRVTIASSCKFKASSCEPYCSHGRHNHCLLESKLLYKFSWLAVGTYLHNLLIAAEFFLPSRLRRGLLLCLSACLHDNMKRAALRRQTDEYSRVSAGMVL